MGDDDTGLSYYFLNTGSGWTDNSTAALDNQENTVAMRLGASTDEFTICGVSFISREARGAMLTLSGSTYT